MALLRELAHALGLDAGSSGLDRPDEIRGWTVMDDTHTEIGRVDDLMYDPDADEVRYAIVGVSGRRVLLPIGELDIEEDHRHVIARGYTRDRMARMRAYDPDTWNEATERETYRGLMPDARETERLDYGHQRFRGEQLPQRLRLLEERLKLGKRREQTGEVTLGKKPVTEQVQEQISLGAERLDITRKPVHGKATDETIAGQAETIQVPLYAERAEVKKETFVREEVEVNKIQDQRPETIRDAVQHEELVTDGLDQTTKRGLDMDRTTGMDRTPGMNADVGEPLDQTVTPARELSFSGTEPTEAELLERRRREGRPLRERDVKITPEKRDDG